MVYTIIYLQVTGRAELLRLIAEEGNIEYKNRFVQFSDMPTLKPELPFGQLPVLIEEDTDFQISQTTAIARYLAQEAGLVPQDNKLAALADSYMQAIADIRVKQYPPLLKSGEEKQTALKQFRSDLKYLLLKLEDILKKNGGGEYFVGDKFSWIDLAVFDILDETEPINNFWNEIPTLTQLRETVAARPRIAQYLKSDRRQFNYFSNGKIEE
jgi:glutathione S-transferase